ncbi:MAG: hypothetical protein PHF56_00930 [Desulfuromonadaceae bacterium]|nr:hypothetical protein [Desulfuromonadaceae bacterium]
MWNKFLFIFLAFTIPLVVFAADSAGYRVAGIVRQGEVWSFAIIEAPDGTSRVFSNGDVIANEGTIVGVTDTGILVENNGIRRLLILQGGRYTTSTTKTTPGETMNLSRELLRTEMRSSLEAVTNKKRTSGNLQPTSAETNELLGIPSQAKITSINGKTINNAGDVIAAVQAELDLGGGLLRIFVDGIEGVSHMYVLLRDEQVPQ